jgi:hypothetical protein
VKLPRILGTLALLLALTFVGATPARADALYANDELACGNNLYSGNGYYRLFCQSSGTVPEYWMLAWRYIGPGSAYTVWNSRYDESYGSGGLGTHQNQWAVVDDDARAVMQGDGNFVLYNYSLTNAVWSTSTYGNYDAWLNLQDDGNMVVYTSSAVPIWSVF